jgi:hypothetical protein
MNRYRRMVSKLRHPFTPRGSEHDLDDEMNAHVTMLAERSISRECHRRRLGTQLGGSSGTVRL